MNRKKRSRLLLTYRRYELPRPVFVVRPGQVHLTDNFRHSRAGPGGALLRSLFGFPLFHDSISQRANANQKKR